jgi:hypothetical protein
MVADMKKVDEEIESELNESILDDDGGKMLEMLADQYGIDLDAVRQRALHAAGYTDAQREICVSGQ